MRIISSLLVISLITMASAYDDIDDTLDFKAMLDTPSELRMLLDCYLDKIPCPKKFVGYRDHAAETVDNACRKCTLLQKHNVMLILKELNELFPEDFKKLGTKYDGDGSHFKILLKEMSKY